MTCEQCELALDTPTMRYAPYRWGQATIGIVACPTHLEQVLTALRAAQAQQDKPCTRCRASGKVANTVDREPWPDWLDLPLRSGLAVVAGVVRPIPCPECLGTGKQLGVG